MRITVVGVGAIGGWIAGALARTGAEVSLVARGDNLAALECHGLRIRDGDRLETHRLAAADHATKLPRPDVVVVAVKSTGFGTAIEGLSSTLAIGPILLTAMNGLPWWFLDGAGGALAGRRLAMLDPGAANLEALGGARPMFGVVHGSVRLAEPGLVQIVKTDRLILGCPGEPPPETAKLAALLEAGGIKAPVSHAIRTDIWSKLWGNMSMNPVSALTRLSATPTLADPALRGLLADMMLEFERVGLRLGLELPMSVEDRLQIAARLGDFRTSMHLDAEAGRRLEIDALLGVVVEMAERLGEPVPTLKMVYTLAKGLDASFANPAGG